jgi:SAM-dependent methyltransferase
VNEEDETRYSTTFFHTQQDGSRRSAQTIIPMVQELLSASSVLDVGCGTGGWLAEFQAAGVRDIAGVDGDYVDLDMLQIRREHFLAHDLTQPLSLNRRYDLVVSLEVAEHLPASSADDFVQSLVRHGDVILFSAAVPYQGGRHHVNEQWPDYWAAKFMACGYVPIDAIRRKIWDNDNVQWWYAQNTILYVNREALGKYPLLQGSGEQTALPLIHPRLYMLLAGDYFGADGYRDGMIVGRPFTPRI